jgi:hypothetical protein
MTTKKPASKTPLCNAPGMTHARAPLDLMCVHCGISLKPFTGVNAEPAELAAIEARAKAELARVTTEQETILARVWATRQARLNDLRRCYTPEDFVAKGFTLDCDAREYREGSEYMYRLKNQLPIRAPRLAVGQQVYDSLSGCNVRVVSVTWEGSLVGYSGFSGWRCSVPGHGGDDYTFGAPREDAPTVEHVQTEWHC